MHNDTEMAEKWSTHEQADEMGLMLSTPNNLELLATMLTRDAMIEHRDKNGNGIVNQIRTKGTPKAR